MRIGVLGNSDTTGQKLPPGERSWPVLVGEQLSERLACDVTVDSWKFAAYRPRATDFGLALVEEAKPDVVVVTLASYWCAFSTVMNGVEQRFGGRAAGLYWKLERFAERFERTGPGLATRRRLVRALSRRMVTPKTLLTFDEFVDVFSELVRELSKREDTEVLVLADHHYTAEMRRKIPDIESKVRRITAAIRPLVEERRLHWGDLEPAIAAGGRREEMIIDDGVHMTAEAHRRVADALVPILERLTPGVTA